MFAGCLVGKETGEKTGDRTDTGAHGGEGRQHCALPPETREDRASGGRVWVFKVTSSDRDWPDLPSAMEAWEAKNQNKTSAIGYHLTEPALKVKIVSVLLEHRVEM